MKTLFTQKYNYNYWARLALFLIVSWSFNENAMAQFATIGSGTNATTSTGSDPIDGYFESMRYQVVYTAAELSAAGMLPGSTINSLGWSISGDYGGGSLQNYTIKLAHTTATNAAAHNTATLTQVVNPFSYNPTVVTAGNFDQIPFNTTFVWDGVNNILVDVCTGTANPYVSPYGQVRTIAASTTSGSRYVRCDACGDQCNTPTGTTNTTKPQVQFGYVAPPACSAAPAVGALTITTAPACGANFTISQPYPGNFSGYTFQWQESTTLGGTYTNVAANGTGISYSAPSGTTTMYYRCSVTCAAASLSATNAPIAVAPPAIAPGTTGISSVAGCSTPGFTLSVTGATTGTLTYQWQDSVPSGSWANTTIATTSATNATLVTTANVSVPTYFRRQTICTSSSITVNTPPFLVTQITGGTAAATPATCGDSLTLSISGNTSGAGVTYQWEISSDSTNWSPIGGATGASQKVISPAAVSYYRCIITCGASQASRFVTVTPVKAGTTSLTSSFCNDSTTLSITGSSSGTVTYNWLQSTDSITWVAMGISSATAKFISPTSNMFYRSVVSCGSSSDSSVALKVTEPCQGFVYSMSRSTSATFTSIQTTGNQFTWTQTSGDDDRSTPVYFPAGFNFTYNGIQRPAFYVCTNGWMTFDTTTLSTAWTNDLTAATPKAILAPFWEDLVTLGGTTASRSYIQYLVTGTAPNRVMTIEWGEMERYNYGAPNLNFQVKLYEGSNNIEYIYGRMQPFDGSGTGDFSYSIGMTGQNPGSGQRLSLLVPNTSNFSGVTINNNLTITPLCNTSYLFTAGGVFNPTTISAVPANDSMGAATPITVNPIPCTDGCGTYYSTLNATASNAAQAPASGNPDDDVWFSITAPASGQVNISFIGSPGFDPAFQLMNAAFDTTGLGDAGSRNVSATSAESVVATGLIPSSTYYIRAFNAGAGAGSLSGSFSICVNEIIPPPANDDTSGSVLLSVGRTCSSIAGTTLGATASPQAVCGGVPDDDVWYKFWPSASVDTIRIDGAGTFRAHAELFTQSMISLGCVASTVNGGVLNALASGLNKDTLYYVRVYHSNSGTATANFSICVLGDSATAPVMATSTKMNVYDQSAIVGGSITSNGGYPVTRSGMVYGTTVNPQIGDPGVVDSTTNPVATTGAFTLSVAGLTPATLYHYRSYATNAMGTSYGPDSTFTTLAAPIVPTVSTIFSYSETTTALIGGNITGNGGAPVSASGIVFSTSPNPVIGDPGVVDSISNPTTQMGAYFFTLAGLSHSTKYYFRSYATNVAGTAYSLNDSFETKPVISVLPYTENFDGASASAWSTTSVNGGTNDWEKGTPTKGFLNAAYSSPNAFVTKLGINYTGGSECALVSPQFDFSTLTDNPVLRFMHKFDEDNDPGYDGGVIQISVNNGAWTTLNSVLGTGTNFNTATSYAWFNNSSANSYIGEPAAYSGISTNYGSADVNGWIQSATVLTGAAGQSNVRFRFYFGADGVTDEGWAVDNIEVVSIATPSTPATAVNLTNVLSTSTRVNWTNGNGNGRLVVARLTSTTVATPTDNKMYTANTAFAAQDSTGVGNYVIYSGNASTVVATGLDILTDYTYDVYEYNGKYMHVKFAASSSANVTTLPVKLLSFTAATNGNDALLNWSTASELNNKGFDVQRSVDGRNFTTVGFVKGSGNSNSTLAYSLNDTKAFEKAGSNTLYYRLKQFDFDGKFEYSTTVKVTSVTSHFNGITVSPNPYNSEFTVSFNTHSAGNATIELVDVQGRMVGTQSFNATAGLNNVVFSNAATVQHGVYFVKVTLNGETQILKLIKN